MPEQKAVLILGLFVDNNSGKVNIRTAEDRLAEMFEKNNIRVIKGSSGAGRIKRLTDTVKLIVGRRNEYDTAIVPLFGTWPAFMLQEVATRLLKMCGKKILLGIHGGSIPARIEKGGNRFLKALKRADVVYAPSRYMADVFKSKGVDVAVVENPVDYHDYTFNRKAVIRPKLLWMRAFSDIYNPLMAVRLAKRMAEKYPDFEMVMAGKEGPLSNTVRQLTIQYNLQNNIHFPGYITMQQKQQFATEYDIHICTNRIDNTPVSLTEFMRFGLPVVSVNVGGIPHLIEDGVNGLLVNDDDDEAMFSKVDALISNNNLAQSIIANAYNYSDRFDEKNVIVKWQQVLQKVGVI